MTKDIILNLNIINGIFISSLASYSEWLVDYNLSQNWLLKDTGTEPYKLLSYLSLLFENHTIVDIGTYRGLSALALSYNISNKVITYDIVDNFKDYKHCNTAEKKNNIEFRIKDCREDVDVFKNTNLVSLDIDPHDGLQETSLFKFFEEINFQGIVILDDINLNENMRRFWNNIKQEKYDISNLGHWSGTGLVQFGKLYNIQIV